MKNKIELLAPAGSYEGFEAALGAGADAVYVGGGLFGARAYAKNFQQDELLRAIDVAHIHGKKLYLTVNTLLKNRELKEQLYDYLKPFYGAGLDAVIVQDMGVFDFIRTAFPDLHIHASTQMTVTGPAGMKLLEKLGAARVVAARELSLKELAEMHQASGIEIEAFVHGALCYSYSGQCLMSSLLGGRSGNRGRCAQPCRLPYETRTTKDGFSGEKERCPLSLKDICTIDILPEILTAGVTSLKIEGRMKQPGYTAGVTCVYRKYLDRLLEKGRDGYFVAEEDKRYLLELFNRGGSCGGYYEMHNGPSMMAFSNEKKTGDVQPEIIKRKEKIYGNLTLFPGSPAILEISCRDIHVAASGGEVQFARSQPMERERILQQMEKLGNTPFQWKSLEVHMDTGIFIPVKALNEVRRDALGALEEEILRKHRRNTASTVFFAGQKNMPSADILPVYVSCEQAETARLLLDEPQIRGLYLPFDAMEECLAQGLELKKEMYLALPHITRGEMPHEYAKKAKQWISMGMKGFLVRNLEAFAILKEQGMADKCVIDHSLYTWNDAAVYFWESEGILRNTVPLELNEGELRHRDNRGSEMLVYGYLPLMVSAQCVKKNIYGCTGQEDTVYLKDRYDKEFPAVCCCRPWKLGNTEKAGNCYNIIYNSIPYGLLKERDKVQALGVGSIRLSFTTEKPGEALGICREFLQVYREHGDAPAREFTKGHFKRGAE